MDAEATVHSPSAPGTKRRQLVDDAREAWIDKLIDTTRRNNLLYFRDLKRGNLDLNAASDDDIAELLEGSGVPVERLVNADNQTRVSAILREIGKRAVTNREEKGLETLFVGIGLATWQPGDGGRPTSSPVILVPVEMVVRGRAGATIELHRKGEPQINPVLLHVLEQDYGYRLDPDNLLRDKTVEEDDEDTASRLVPTAIFERLARAVPKVGDFAVQPRVVLGNFSFQKMAMVQDLRLQADGLAANTLIAAMAGDLGTRQELQNDPEAIDPREFDLHPIERELLVMDADSSQQRVVETIRRRQSCVIQGPPGTGKSQTISNLIAVLAGEGQRVLFVAEKRAALEVVQRRLEASGLGHLALDLHGADLSRKEILKRVGVSLETVRNTLPADGHGVEARLAERRQRLNDYVRVLHANRPTPGMSAFEMQGRLLRMPEGAKSNVRWRGAALNKIDAAASQRVLYHLQEAAGSAGLFMEKDPSPWSGASLPTAIAATEAIDLALQADGHWKSVAAAIGSIQRGVQGLQPHSLEDVANEAFVLHSVNRTLERYRSDIWGADLASIAGAMTPASRSWFAAFWAGLFDARFREAVSTLQGFRREGAVSPKQLWNELSAMRDQLARWGSLLGAEEVPRSVPEADALHDAYGNFHAAFSKLQAALAPARFEGLQIEDIERTLGSLAGDSVTPHRIPRMIEIERELEECGVGAIVGEIRAAGSEPSLWAKVFEFAWLSSCLESARAQEPILASFSGRTQDEIVEEFRTLDRERLRVAIARVSRLHAEHAVAAMNAHPEQTFLVRHEAQKKARHKPIRKLLAEAPDVLLALFPCWMASPLSVSQLIGPDRQYFDVVVFDEASQVLPEDAVPSILRARRVAVAGDRQQLPPTTFFADGSNEDEDADESLMSEGFESLLDQMSSFLPTQMLEWHYRSLDEKLIAFSNHHIYNDRLVTFPGPGGRVPPVSHVLVPNVLGEDGQEESATPEVRRVVELVLQHAKDHPDESLGVIAMGIKHANKVEAALDQALKARPDLDSFFDTTRGERFFVKNLERVQGDERDAIILTVGYGKDRAGKLPHRFGPINNAGGERRLNVAITRARRRMTVVSSFDHHDVDPARSRARGVELLKLFLEFASTQGRHLGDTQLTEVPMNPFEEDVYYALERAGLKLVPQLGTSRYRLDFAVQHPEQPGRYVLAIECDGATYHSAPTARDRDRLRQQQLEALGWNFHRIWSTDWFASRDEEVKRATAAYRRALQSTPTQSGGAAPLERKRTPEQPTHERPPVARQGARPPVIRKEKIDEYYPTELVKLVRWILSDGLLRTDDQIVDEMLPELGFRKRGSRIVTAITRAIHTVRGQSGSKR